MVETLRATFPKAERLCSKKRIDTLFSGSSRSLSAFPLRAVYALQGDAKSPVQILTSVSKRHLRHAVDRNRVKRLIRETYRLNKSVLYDSLGDHSIAIAFIWMSDTVADFTTVESRMRNLLARIAEGISQ